MFAAWCAAEGHEVLLSERRILRLEHDGAGTTLIFRCWCGAVGTTRIERRYGLPSDRIPA
ncbi:hypothetical protein BH20ACT2_BH20ACT2_11900 [soil metagenome]